MQGPAPRWYDVSNNNGLELGKVASARPGDDPLAYNVDMPALKATGAEGVFIKVTEGGSFVDRFAAGNLRQAVLVGLRVGLYHFAHPGQTDARSVAIHHAGICRTVCAQAGIDPAEVLNALDLEVAEAVLGQALAAWCEAWLGTVESALGLGKSAGVFYSYVAFIHDNIGPAAGQLVAWRLWLAAYQGNEPAEPFGWPIWMWQHTDESGIRNVGDESYRYGPLTLAEDNPWPCF